MATHEQEPRATMTLKSWREVIIPHEDVLDGNLQEASFAADLTKVVQGVAPLEYRDPVRFFERTVITEGMSLLLQAVLKRLSGKGGEPVVQLQTAFGGGKTHTMLAVYHVAGGKVAAKKMLGIPELLDKAMIKELVRGNVAVLDGNALAPAEPREHGRITAKTLWGELAWQLGKEDGYALVAASDREGTSPGKDVLAKLFTKYGPAVVLLDETVAYLRQFEAGRSYPGGSYNSNLSFLQALTEAAAGVPTAMVLASLPESQMEAGDHVGQQALDSVQKIFGRIEAVWKPVGMDEAFEIVRRRLFRSASENDAESEAARDEVCRAFADMYKKDADKFPSETREGTYQRRLKASYPIHPEVFSRLYEDWSSLPKFQRTRGVLRLMAKIVNSLWRSGNQDLLIMPGLLPLDDLTVRNELVKYLPTGWDPIVDRDIDGSQAEPRRIDDDTPSLGSLQACRRSARTIFLGSAPSVSEQKVRGIGIERVRLGCAVPGQSVTKYDDALRRLTDRLHYLYTGNERYWFDLRTNLRREMEDRMQRYDEKGDLYPEIKERLERLIKSSLFSGIHVFTEGKDVPDKIAGDLRLVVLSPEHGHRRKDGASKATQAAQQILTRHGDRQREYQNRLLFLAPDTNAAQTLLDQVRRYLAWQSIVEEADALNLDKHNEKEAKKNCDDAGKRVEASVRETYRYLLAPMQDPDTASGPAKIAWEDEPLTLAGSSYERVLDSVTKEREWIIRQWAPAHLRTLLSKWFWKDDRPSTSTNKVWHDTCRYLYMPRLSSSEVFLDTIRDGLMSKEWFGYASAEPTPGAYQGLLLERIGTAYLDDTSVLVHPEAAAKALPKPVESTAEPTGDSSLSVDQLPSPLRLTEQRSGRGGSTGSGLGGLAPAANASLRRFHGTANIDPRDPIASFTEIVQNVIEHFTAQYGTQVTLSLDIEARRPSEGGGFDPKTIRIARENATTLKFKTAEFEEE